MNLSSTQRRSLSWIALGLIGLGLLWLLAPVLTPFLIGAVLAYALHPPVERMARRGVPRAIAVTVVEVTMLVVLLAVLLLVVPILSKELPLLREQIPRLVTGLNTTLEPWLAQFGIHVALDIDSIQKFALKYLNANIEDWLLAILSSARIGGSIMLTIIGTVVLVPVVLFYLLMDWPRLALRVQELVPPRLRPGFFGFMRECDTVLGQYLRGQLLVMLAMAIFYSVGLALFRFDLAVPVGVFTGLAMFIPYVGFGLGMLLALLAGVLQFAIWYGAIAVLVVFGLGQMLEGFYLTPRLVGERIGLSPLAVIFALLAFGHIFGFAGVLVALPVSAMLVVATSRIRGWYVQSRLYGA
ncbi:MAG: AI-2E family transporter [Burkholderiales bacterium]|nr:AI-2E family transporter [Burkholderiales bacterium]